jgi:hypothetical protein
MAEASNKDKSDRRSLSGFTGGRNLKKSSTTSILKKPGMSNTQASIKVDRKKSAPKKNGYNSNSQLAIKEGKLSKKPVKSTT